MTCKCGTEMKQLPLVPNLDADLRTIYHWCPQCGSVHKGGFEIGQDDRGHYSRNLDEWMVPQSVRLMGPQGISEEMVRRWAG